MKQSTKLKLENVIRRLIKEESYVTVDTSKYENAHGKKPRGVGGWAFEIKGKELFAPGSLPYEKALSWAKEQAQKVNATMIKVLS